MPKTSTEGQRPSPKLMQYLMRRHSLEGIAEKYGRRYITVRGWLEAYNLEVPGPRQYAMPTPRPPKDQLSDMLAYMPVWTACEHYEVGDRLMRLWRKELEITHIKCRQNPRAGIGLDEHDFELMLGLKAQGLTTREIASKFSCSVTYVSKKIKELQDAGIPPPV